MPHQVPPPPATPSTFADLALDPRLLSALETLGYEEPTPIQREAIPFLLAGRDLLGQAATGTGKTAAFALPLLQRITALQTGPTRLTRALILVPTRELAMQVTEAVHRYGKGLGTRVLPIYGGQPIERQLRALKGGVDVVVATPGRALDHMRRKTLVLDHVSVVVLDEADEMLDMGFAEDLEAILGAVPPARQTALFSATMPPRIEAIARRHLKDPVRLQIAREVEATGEAPRVRHTAYVVARAHKLASLARLIDVERPTAALVFCRTRLDVDQLVETLNARGYQAEALHGGMSQEQRDRVMRKFRAGTTELLAATDVAARGLDIEHVSHVINYDVPSAPEAYVHRTGRTGRAGREGVAITLVEPREHRLIRNIEQQMRHKIWFAALPTVADLRARQLELTRATLREALAGGDLERYRVVVDALSSEFDVMEVAMAAVKVMHEASGAAEDEQEIPTPTPPARTAGPDRKVDQKFDRKADTKFGKADHKLDHKKKAAAEGKPGAHAKPAHAKPDERERKPGKPGKPDFKVARLFVGAGRVAGIRPADLVGAICNETGLDRRAIGAIEIADRFSLVELPEDVLDDVIPIMRKAKIKGKQVIVRRDLA